MKGYGINQLAPIAIVFVVAFVLFGVGQIIMTGLQEEFCDYTFLDTNYCARGADYCNSTTVNPVTSQRFGCCQTTNESHDCVTWNTEKYSINTSYQGQLAITELADWGPTLALVIIAAIIIGVLITYLAKSSG